MSRHYFPIITTGRFSIQSDCLYGNIELLHRRWRVSTFDIATLVSSHKVSFPFGLLDFYANKIQFEIAISANTLDEAIDIYEIFRLALYCKGVSPFFCPFTLSHSINDISGINSRDSNLLDSLPEELKAGLKSSECKVEVDGLEINFVCHPIYDSKEITENILADAVSEIEFWQNAMNTEPPIYAGLKALQSSPFLLSKEQAIMHLWTGIEALFPEVNQEVVFRLSLYIASILQSDDRIMDYKRVKSAYAVRSKIAHGASNATNTDSWENAWKLATDIFKSIRIIGRLPKEEEIIRGLLS